MVILRNKEMLKRNSLWEEVFGGTDVYQWASLENNWQSYIIYIQMDVNLLVTERLQKTRDPSGVRLSITQKESLFDHLSQLAPLLESFQKDKIAPITNF